MNVLALDTATPGPSVCLLARGKIFEETLSSDRRASEELLPAVRRLVSLPEDSLLRRSLRRIYRRMSWISLDAVLGTEIFAKTTKVAERDFGPIREFLGKSS